MSPEQARGDTVTGASDVFSLGVMLYELATATHPFESASTLAMLHAITSTEAPSPRRLVPDMPPRSSGCSSRCSRRRPRSGRARPTSRPSSCDWRPDRVHRWARGPRSQPCAGRTRGLPSQRTPLIGRAAERTRVSDLLRGAGVRLLTLTGPGGLRQDAPGHSGRRRPRAPTSMAAWPSSTSRRLPTPGSWLRPSPDRSACARAATSRCDKAIAEHLRQPRPDAPPHRQFRAGLRCRGAWSSDLLEACPALTALVTSRAAAPHLRRAGVSRAAAAAAGSRGALVAGDADAVRVGRPVRRSGPRRAGPTSR